MKKQLQLLTFLLLSLAASAQIPNAGFETWISAGSFEDAQGWASFNPYTQVFSIETVTKTTDSHSGTFAALVETKSFFNTITTMQDTIAGLMVTGNDVLLPDNGFPYMLRPDSLSAWYKYTQAGSDFGGIGVILSKWNSAAGARDYIATGEISVTSSAVNFTLGSAPLNYLLPDYPDTAFIYIAASNGSVAYPGSSLTVDDISLVTIVGINETAANFIDILAYPNPAKENIRFRISTPLAFSISIYDFTGRIISSLHSGNKTFVDADMRNYDAGLYFYIVTAKDRSRKASGKFCVTK